MPSISTILLEAFGYLGTALVICSMLMTSVVKLRLLNICGSLISTVYALIGHAFPIVLLNVALILINLLQLVRMSRAKKAFRHVRASLQDASVQYFLSLYEEDIKKYLPEYTLPDKNACEVHLAYIGSEAVGIVVGIREADVMQLQLDYAMPKYRDLSVSGYLFSKLEENGIGMLYAADGVQEYKSYLSRIGFSEDGKRMKKVLHPKEKDL